jgi:hypothetical protein
LGGVVATERLPLPAFIVSSLSDYSIVHCIQLSAV